MYGMSPAQNPSLLLAMASEQLSANGEGNWEKSNRVMRNSEDAERAIVLLTEATPYNPDLPNDVCICPVEGERQ